MLKSAYKSFILEAKVGFKVVDKDTRTDHNKRLVHGFDGSAKLVRPLDMTVSVERKSLHGALLESKISLSCLFIGWSNGRLVGQYIIIY